MKRQRKIFEMPSESFQEDNREETEEVGGLEDDFRPILIKKDIFLFSFLRKSRRHWTKRSLIDETGLEIIFETKMSHSVRDQL